MKPVFSFFLFLISICFLSCNNDKTSSEKTEPGKSSEPPTLATTNNASSGGEGLTGTWKLQKEVYDDNGNRIPDEEEMKKAYGNNYMLQLNADGSCRIQQIFTGRYEKKTENGREMLYIYRKKVEGEEDQDPPPDVYQVTSLKNDELVLQIIEAGMPSSFWFFTRIK